MFSNVVQVNHGYFIEQLTYSDMLKFTLLVIGKVTKTSGESC